METKLTAKDLMVGDWVIYNPNVFIEDEYEPYKEPYLCRIESGEQIDDAVNECYSPIPLTAEILEKNGLKPHKRYIGMFVERTDKYQLYVTGNHITAYILLEDGAEEHQWMLPRPMYVHEFQHAVKNFKINKEIVL